MVGEEVVTRPSTFDDPALGGAAGACIIRSASLRLASRYVGSLRRTSAWSGVLVCGRRTWQNSRSGASNVFSAGGGAVRFQKVYRLRRYKSSPWACTDLVPG